MGKKSKTKIKEEIFDLYSKNFENHFPEHKGIYVCPICKKGCNKSGIYNNALTLEHIIPQSLGGKSQVTLTCSECNNGSLERGGNIEADLKKYLDFEDFLSGSSHITLRGKTSFNDSGDVSAQIRFVNEPNRNYFDVEYAPERSNPKNFNKFMQNLNEGSGGIANVIFSDKYDYQKYLSSILKSAYLLMFRVFGYGYIFSPPVNSIREKILNPSMQTNVIYSIAELTESEIAYSDNELFKLSFSNGLKFFMPYFTYKNENSHAYGVALPTLTPKSDSFFDDLQKLGGLGQNIRTSYHGTVKFDESNLIDISRKNFAIEVWR